MADSRIIGGNAPTRGRNDARIIALLAALSDPHSLLRLRAAGEDVSGLVGDYDDLSGFDDDIGDLVGDLVGDHDEIGRRHRQRRVQRVASRHGMVAMPKSQASALVQAARARENAADAANMQAMQTGKPVTAGRYLAATDQVELYLPFSAAASLAAAVNSTQTLSATVQRPLQIHRIILSAYDNTTFADALITVGVTGVFIGVAPIFNASGVAPAQAFASTAVGAKLLAPPATVGQVVSVNLVRPSAVTNPSIVSGYCVGVSAS